MLDGIVPGIIVPKVIAQEEEYDDPRMPVPF